MARHSTRHLARFLQRGCSPECSGPRPGRPDRICPRRRLSAQRIIGGALPPTDTQRRGYAALQLPLCAMRQGCRIADWLLGKTDLPLLRRGGHAAADVARGAGGEKCRHRQIGTGASCPRGASEQFQPFRTARMILRGAQSADVASGSVDDPAAAFGSPGAVSQARPGMATMRRPRPSRRHTITRCSSI